MHLAFLAQQLAKLKLAAAAAQLLQSILRQSVDERCQFRYLRQCVPGWTMLRESCLRMFLRHHVVQ
jgi:hypothetical protein